MSACVGGSEGGRRAYTHAHTPLPFLLLLLRFRFSPAPAPDPWRPLFSQYGEAALHEAVRRGHTGAVEVLLQAKADLNLKNKVWVPGVCFGME